jgi:hypothetical protein
MSGRAPRSATLIGFAESRSFVAFWNDEKRVVPKCSSLPRGSADEHHYQ